LFTLRLVAAKEKPESDVSRAKARWTRFRWPFSTLTRVSTMPGLDVLSEAFQRSGFARRPGKPS
jgi:hypothetical protein